MKGCAIITGHLGGLGSALVEQFAELGYRVIGIDRNSGKTKAHAQIELDISELLNPDSHEKLLEAIAAATGDSPLKVLVHNAALQHLGEIVNTPISRFVESIEVNAIGPLILTRVLFPMLEASRATVISINSVHATQSKAGFAPYSISKSALSGVNRALAIELGEQIRVIEVRPAAIATPMLEAGFNEDPKKRQRLAEFHPTGDIGKPEEVAMIIAGITDMDAQFLNGAVLNIDGGITHVLHDPA